jgi:hypothetical protein
MMPSRGSARIAHLDLVDVLAELALALVMPKHMDTATG